MKVTFSIYLWHTYMLTEWNENFLSLAKPKERKEEAFKSCTTCQYFTTCVIIIWIGNPTNIFPDWKRFSDEMYISKCHSHLHYETTFCCCCRNSNLGESMLSFGLLWFVWSACMILFNAGMVLSDQLILYLYFHFF